MRSTFNGLNTMVKGIFANQLSLDTVGHNIVNASTEGYSRQSVNLAASLPQMVGSIYGDVALGTGVESTSIVRARDIYADKQYRAEVANQEYNTVMQQNYQKLETVFNDTDESGVQQAMMNFYKSWISLSTHASDNSYREDVVSQGRNLSDLIQSSTAELQSQITAIYDDMSIRVDKINEITEKMLLLNKQVVMQEANGSNANDLRDQRDLLADQLATYLDISVYEQTGGAYIVVSNGATLVNDTARLTLTMSEGLSSASLGLADYGVADYTIKFKETDTVAVIKKGSIKADFDAIAENKYFIDRMATMAAFMLSTFNEQHKAGLDMNGADGVNFFGETKYTYEYNEKHDGYNYDALYDYIKRTDADGNSELLSGVKIIAELEVNTQLSITGGAKYVAARAHYDENGNDLSNIDDLTATADGSNAVLMADFFNMTRAYTETTSKKIQHLYTLADKNGNTVYKDTNGNTIEAELSDPDDGSATYRDSSGAILLYRDSDGNYYNDTDTTTATALDYPPQYNEDGTVSFVDSNGNVVVTLTPYREIRAMDDISINAYYNATMTQLGIRAETMNIRVKAQDDLMVQISNWRNSAMGVDWNEELTNMIKFQKGYGACARCLTAMDEMLDRLVNNTGMVGR